MPRHMLGCRDTGPADSTDVLVLIHGFPLSSAMWRPQLDEPPPGWRVVAPDLRGFGDSPPVAGDVLSMEDAADQVAMLINSLELGPVVICGLSMGGYVSFALLRRYPALLRALVLCDTRAAADTEEVRRGRLQAAAKIDGAGTADFMEGMLPKLFSTATTERNPELVADVRAMMAAAPPAAVMAALRGMAARPDSTPLLRSIDVPTLVVVGEDDAITPADDVRLMARSIPGAAVETVPHAGHLPNLENPAAFNSALHGFLAALD